MASEHMPTKRPHALTGGDRLSALPDDLLLSVMSSLTTQQAVQTCALSRRWRDLWRSVPCLDMDSDTFMTSKPPEHWPHVHPKKLLWHKLKDFTDNMFLHHSAPTLDRFRLHINLEIIAFHSVYEASNHMDTWIRQGLRYNLVEVSLEFLPRYCLTLPPMASTSCRLRRLHLSGMKLDAGFANRLRFECPVLEELELINCVCLFLEMVSASLKSLTIDRCNRTRRHWINNDQLQCVRVIVPSLVSLRLVLVFWTYHEGIFSVEADSLVTASITAYDPYMLQVTSAECLRKVFAKLVSVRTLKLSRFSRNVESLLVDGPWNFPKFHRLSTLGLDDCNMAEELHLLQSFVRNSPSLEEVVLRHCKVICCRHVICDNLRCSKRNKATRISSESRNLVISKSEDSSIIQVKYREDDIREMFGFLSSFGRKLLDSTIILTKL